MSAPSIGRVSVSTRSVRRLRIGAALPRCALYAIAVVGVADTVRGAVDPPRPAPPPVVPAAPALAAEGLATQFARDYLTWAASNPTGHAQALAPLLGPTADPDAGLEIPSTGEENVLWTQIVQARQRSPGEWVFNVAADTDRAGVLYLAVDVGRAADGELFVEREPAFVGPPATTTSSLDPDTSLPDVTESGLITVVDRALRNYLAGDASDLSADLTAGAAVSLPTLDLSLERVEDLKWEAGRTAVIADVEAAEPVSGVGYELSYELDVGLVGGRWEISAIEMDPLT